MNVRTPLCDPGRITAFLDGHLSELEQSAFEAHLSDCAGCRALLGDQTAEQAFWDKASRYLRDDGDTTSFVAMDDGAMDGDPSPAIHHVLNSLAPTDDPQMLGRLGGYEIAGVVGTGGMGVVLKAFDRSLDRTVAIKVMMPHLATSGAARKRFAREAKAAAAVLHPNVLAIHSVSTDESLPYLVMPYLRGTSLQKRLDQQGPLPVNEILRIAAQTAAGLAAAHAQGLVHRDIKPANILLEEGVERVALSDFGLARAVDDAAMTRTGVVAGTPQYMSPEQARGASVDQRSDLFSLGSVVYAMCTGRAPFRAESSYGVLRRITDDEPTSLRDINPDIPDWLCRIVNKLMAKKPEDRFESAAEVAQLLEACLAHIQQPTAVKLPRSLVAPHPSRRKPSSSRFSRRVAAMCAVFGAIALGAMVWQALSPPDIAGRWTGEGWGEVVLAPTKQGQYHGTFTGQGENAPGTLQVNWSRLERRFHGTWRHGDIRQGKISLHLVGQEIRGAWTTNTKSEISAESPRLAELLWTKTGAPPSADPSAMKLASEESVAKLPGQVHPAPADAQVVTYRFPPEFEGRWRIAGAEIRGHTVPSYVGQTAEITGGTLLLRSSRAANTYHVTFVEAQAAQIALDLTAFSPNGGQSDAVTFRCLFQVSDGRLLLCRPQNADHPRPLDLASPRSSDIVFTLERDGQGRAPAYDGNWRQPASWLTKGPADDLSQWPHVSLPSSSRRLEICEAIELSASEAAALAKTEMAHEILYLHADDGQVTVLRRKPASLLTETDLKSAVAIVDPYYRPSETYSIELKLTDEATRRFADDTRRLTQAKSPVRLAILVPGRILAAPRLVSEIPDGKIRITGDFTRQAAERLAAELMGVKYIPSSDTTGFARPAPGLQVQVPFEENVFPAVLNGSFTLLATGVKGSVDGKEHDNLVAVLAHDCRLISLKNWQATLYIPQGPGSDGSNRTLTQQAIDTMRQQGVKFTISPKDVVLPVPEEARMEPLWGEPVAGLQLGISGLDQGVHFLADKTWSTIRVQPYVRNTSQEPIRIRYSVSEHSDWIAPSVTTAAGEPVRVEAMRFRGGHRTITETLEPGAVVRVQVEGRLLLGNADVLSRMLPRVPDIGPGEYLLTLQSSFARVNADNVSEAVMLTSGAVRFVVQADSAPADDVDRGP